MLYSVKILDKNDDIVRVAHTHDFDNAVGYYKEFTSDSYPEVVRVKMTVDNTLVVMKVVPN